MPSELVSFWCNMLDGEVHALMIHSEPVAVLAHRLTESQKRHHDYVEAIRADPHPVVTPSAAVRVPSFRTPEPP